MKKEFCPLCCRYIDTICKYCGTQVWTDDDGKLCFDNPKTMLIFEDNDFESKYLLLTPPNKIEVPRNLSFRKKVIIIMNILDMKIFTLSTQIQFGPYVYYPRIVEINGRIRYMVTGFNPELLHQVTFKKYSFYYGVKRVINLV